MFEVMLSGNVSTVLGDTLVVLISMTLLLFLVKFFAWDKVNAMLEARREKIAKDLDEAAEKRKSAEEIQANANEIIHNAEVKGSEILDNAREAASKTQVEPIGLQYHLALARWHVVSLNPLHVAHLLSCERPHLYLL